MYKVLASTPWAAAGEACLCVFLNYCMVLKRSQYVHNHIVRWGKHITYTSSSRALVLVQCGHSMVGVPFLAGLWMPCNWGLFWKGTQKPHLMREDPQFSVGTGGQTSCVLTVVSA